MANSRQGTARARLAGTLTEEILRCSSENPFLIASEHQLCHRFDVSRVTVRLALADLEARGLIFRKHGKGTYAFGRFDRPQRTIGVLLKSQPTAENSPTWEKIRGLRAHCAISRANVLLTDVPPWQWSADLIRDLDAVLVFPIGVDDKDMSFFAQRKLPYMFAWETTLPGACVNYGQLEAAKVTTESLLLGGHDRITFLKGFEPTLDAVKRRGILEALQAVGKKADDLNEVSLDEHCDHQEAFIKVLSSQPCPGAVIVADHFIALRFIRYLHNQTTIRVPETMSVISFHQPPYFISQDIMLSSFHFDFFEGGKRAAEFLNQAALTGDPVSNVQLPGKFVSGKSVGQRAFTRVSLVKQLE